MNSISHTQFNREWARISNAYGDRARRAALSWYTRSTRLRLQGADRRYRVELRRLRKLCGCYGCSMCR